MVQEDVGVLLVLCDDVRRHPSREFDGVGDAVGFVESDFALHFQVHLDKNMGARRSGAKVVKAAYALMGKSDFGDLIAVLVGKFAVHQNVEGVESYLPGGTDDVSGDTGGKQRVGRRPPHFAGQE